MRRGRLSGSTRRKGGDMGRERLFDVHTCTGGAVSWRKTWDTGTAPFSATLAARDSARHHSYVQLKRGVLCCDIHGGNDRQRLTHTTLLLPLHNTLSCATIRHRNRI